MSQPVASGSLVSVHPSVRIATITEFPRSIKEITNVWIRLSDGCRLAARIWMPADAGRSPVPAILEYLPYRKRDFTAERDALVHPYFAGHGYASIRVDIRGCGDSDGLLHDEYLKQEQDDALEVIDWIAAQPWCTGAVGMIGISWGGFNSLQVAARRPRQLKAIITICSTDDRYADDVHYIGGCLLKDNLTWGSTMLALMSRPPDPLLVGDRWRAMWLQRLNHLPLFTAEWLRHQRRDGYWKHGSVCEDFDAVECPVYVVGGWTDGYTNAVSRLLAGLKVPRKGLIGPWAHRYPHLATPGPQMDFLGEAVRWWDKWLKGIETGVMDGPMLRAWLQDSVRPAEWYGERPGRWIGEPHWPSTNIGARRFHLTADGLAPHPGVETPVLVQSPETVGLLAGTWSVHGVTPDEASDQREDDGKSAVFDSAPLEEHLAILGAPVVELDVAADRPVAKLAVRLCDVHPDGASMRVSYGVLNLAHDRDHETPSPLIPGRRYHFRVQLKQTSYVFPPGNRIRVALSSTYWPMTWPTPERVQMTFLAGSASVVLPERKPRPEDDGVSDLGRPVSPAPASVEVLRRGSVERTVTRDIGSRQTIARMVDDYGCVRLEENGIEMGSRRHHEFRIADEDPLSARAETRWTIETGRGEWRTRSESHVVQTASREGFHVQAELVAFEGDKAVVSRNWDCVVPRDLL